MATSRISQIAWSFAPDGSFTTTAVYTFSDGSTHNASLTVRPDQFQYYLAQAQKLQPPALVDFNPTSNPSPNPQVADVARLLHDFYYAVYQPAPVATPQTGNAPDIE